MPFENGGPIGDNSPRPAGSLQFAADYYVTFTSENGLTVTVLMDSTPPVLSKGSGWDVVDRPKRVAMTRWKGDQPLQQTLSIMFNGDTSVESDIATLSRMADPVVALGEPPKVLLSGFALRTDIHWVMQPPVFTTENVKWTTEGGNAVRIRQPATVTLMEFVDDNVITTKASPAIVSRSDVAPPKRVQVPQTTTLNDLAIQYYHDPSMWQTIWLANTLLVHDPRAIIPKGTTVDIPGKTIVTVH